MQGIRCSSKFKDRSNLSIVLGLISRSIRQLGSSNHVDGVEFKSHRNVRRESSLYPRRPVFLGLRSRRYLASLPRDDRAELGFERLGKASELHAHGADKFIDSRGTKGGAGMKLLIAPMGGT